MGAPGCKGVSGEKVGQIMCIYIYIIVCEYVCLNVGVVSTYLPENG